jgi:hypothetical protein
MIKLEMLDTTVQNLFAPDDHALDICVHLLVYSYTMHVQSTFAVDRAHSLVRQDGFTSFSQAA